MNAEKMIEELNEIRKSSYCPHMNSNFFIASSFLSGYLCDRVHSDCFSEWLLLKVGIKHQVLYWTSLSLVATFGEEVPGNTDKYPEAAENLWELFLNICGIFKAWANLRFIRNTAKKQTVTTFSNHQNGKSYSTIKKWLKM